MLYENVTFFPEKQGEQIRDFKVNLGKFKCFAKSLGPLPEAVSWEDS